MTQYLYLNNNLFQHKLCDIFINQLKSEVVTEVCPLAWVTACPPDISPDIDNAMHCLP